MKKVYNGLDAAMISFGSNDGFFATTSNCIRVIANTEDQMVCVDDETHQVIINFTRDNPAYEYCD